MPASCGERGARMLIHEDGARMDRRSGRAQDDLTVLICGEAPLESDANASIRSAIADGWRDVLAHGRLFTASLRTAAVSIDAVRPDLVLCSGSYLPETAYFGELAEAARRAGSRTAFWATEDPYEKDASYRIEAHFDAIFTCDRWTQRFYDHQRVFHLPLAASPALHFMTIDEARERPIDVLFCGVAFANRRDLMRRLLPALAGLTIAVIGPGWGGFSPGRPGFSDQRVGKSRLIELYAQSKIVLNLGRGLHFENTRYQIAASTPGPRTFEAAMAGTLQFFHEETPEIREYFSDDEVPGFTSPHEFRGLLKRFLADPAAREDAAGRAQARSLAEHTYALRARSLAATLSREGLL